MGGKSKQRTKNNVRPSSSGRSAELLTSSLGTMPPILGTVGGNKPFPSLFSTLQTDAEVDLNSDFMLCVKKLNKKDPITKTKALAELNELVQKSSVEEVCGALALWARLYPTLALDADHKVRESTQVCHGSIVRVCGRRTAPQLRLLLPAWLQAQYDPAPPAAAAAAASLHSTFPAAKLPEVLSFCKAELMTHFTDTIIGDPDGALANRVSPDSLQASVSRVLCASLQGLQYVCENLPAEHDEWLRGQLDRILAHDKYWALAKHEDHNVRVAWLGTAAALTARLGRHWQPKLVLRVLGAALAGAGASVPAVAARAWPLLLALLANTQEECKKVWADKKKELVKKILDTLSNGGWGEARHTSEMLLPLLAHLPEDILNQEFYRLFFDALFKGLEKKTVSNSKSERQYWIRGIAECFRYMSVQENSDITGEILRHWLNNILSYDQETNLTTSLTKLSATEMTGILKYWFKQSQNNPEKYEILIRNFWQNISMILLTQINQITVSTVERSIDEHTVLLQTLKHALTHDTKTKKSIRFDGDPNPIERTDRVVLSDETSTRYNHNLNSVVYKVCASYLEIVDKLNCEVVITPLLTLIREFNSLELFKALSDNLGGSTVYDLYDRVLRPWLLDEGKSCDALVDVVFLMMQHLSDEEKAAVYASFDKLGSCAAQRAVRCALSSAGSGSAAWLLSRVAQQAVLRLALRTHDDVVLPHLTAPEMILPETLLEQLAATAASNLDSNPELNWRQAARLLAALATIRPSLVESLLRRLYCTTMLPKRDIECIPAEDWEELVTSWQDGFAALAQDSRDGILADCIRQAHQQLLNSIEDMDIQLIEHTATVCLNFIQGTTTEDSTKEIEELTTRLMELSLPNAESCEYYAMRADCVTSRLVCLTADNELATRLMSSDDDATELSRDSLASLGVKTIFRASWLSAVLRWSSSDEDQEEPSDSSSRAIWSPPLVHQVALVMKEYAVLDALQRSHAFWEHHPLIERICDHVAGVATHLATTCGARTQIAHCLATQAADHGYYWAFAESLWRSMCEGDEAVASRKAVDLSSLQDITGSGFFHTMQANASSPEELVATTRAIMVAAFYMAWGPTGRTGQTGPTAVDSSFIATCASDTGALDAVINAYYKHNEVMLFDADLNTCEWSHVSSVVATVRHLTACVAEHGWDMADTHWDYVNITLCSLLTALARHAKGGRTVKISMVSDSVSRLLEAVSFFIGQVPWEAQKRQPSGHVAHLPHEWGDIFAPDIRNNVRLMVLEALNGPLQESITSHEAVYIASLIRAVPVLRGELPSGHEPRTLVRSVTDATCRALRAKCHYAYPYLAYAVLGSYEHLFNKADAECGGNDQLSPMYFEGTLKYLSDELAQALEHVELGAGVCATVASSEPHSRSLSLALLVSALTARQVAPDLHHAVLHCYRTLRLAEVTLPLALRLLPSLAPTDLKPYAHCFLQPPSPSLDAHCSHGVVSQWWCFCIRGVLQSEGAGVRAWRAAAALKAQRALEAVTRAYVAPALLAAELKAVAALKLEDTEVTVHSAALHVEVAHDAEERLLRLRIELFPLHPLQPPKVGPSEAHGPLQHHWLALYLAHQNGSVSGAVRMWVSALSAKLSSAPVCYICYGRLLNGALPKAACHTCHNKFHSACLHKWFATSNKSSCPLCRTAF